MHHSQYTLILNKMHCCKPYHVTGRKYNATSKTITPRYAQNGNSGCYCPCALIRIITRHDTGRRNRQTDKSGRHHGWLLAQPHLTRNAPAGNTRKTGLVGAVHFIQRVSHTGSNRGSRPTHHPALEREQRIYSGLFSRRPCRIEAWWYSGYGRTEVHLEQAGRRFRGSGIEYEFVNKDGLKFKVIQRKQQTKVEHYHDVII